MTEITCPINSRGRTLEIRRQATFWLLAFFLPALAMLAVFAAVGFYPFGEKSLLTADMYGQYTCFLSYLKDMAANGNDLFYTFSKSLGGDMFGFAAYYLFSPFNWITLFFPTRALPQAVMLLTLLKTGTAGLTFYIFASRESGLRKSALLFSTGYALTAYMFVYQQNIIWLDAVVGLPVVLLGLHRLVTEEKPLLYAFSLALCLAVNYYTGYFLCLFSVLFFLYKAAVSFSLRSREQRGELARSALRFALSSLLAAGIAAAVLLPTALSLQGGSKGTSAFSSLDFTVRHSLLGLVSKTYSGSFEYNDLWSTNLPSVFCGVLTVGMTILFFLNRRISLKERLAGAALLAAMAVSNQFQIFYLLWHGFNFPVGFPCRQAFLISFVMLYLGYRCCANIDGITPPRIGASLALYGIVTLLIGHTSSGQLTKASLAGDFCLMLLFAGLLLLVPRCLGHRRINALLFAAVLLLQTANLAWNGLKTLERIPYYRQEEFTEAIDQVKPVVDWVKRTDTGFYRMEKTFQRDINDPMLYSYRGLSHFSSTEKTATKAFLGRLGFRNNGTWAYYNHGSTIAVDSLLGVKYVLAKTRPNPYYKALYTQNGITVYQNPYALPIAFAANHKITEVSASGNDPFALQNRIFSAILGEETALFLPVEDVQMELRGLTEIRQGLYGKDGAGVVEFHFTASRTDPVYVYLPTHSLKKANLKVNGRDLGTYFDIRRYDAVCLGEFEEGEPVTLTVTALEDQLCFTDAYFYYQDMARTAAAAEDLTAHPYAVSGFSSSRLRGTVMATRERDYLLTTIPADGGWSVFVDGRRAEPVKVFDALWAVKLSPGTHTVEWRYIPRGLLPGVAISAFSLLAAALFSSRRKKSHREQLHSQT